MNDQTTSPRLRQLGSAARRLVLEYGGDPESITLAEMNLKLHRFGFYKNGELVAQNWEIVGVRCCEPTTHHALSSSIININPFAYYRFLEPNECLEFVHDPDAYNEGPSWCCLRCWRHGKLLLRVGRSATLPGSSNALQMSEFFAN